MLPHFGHHSPLAIRLLIALSHACLHSTCGRVHTRTAQQSSQRSSNSSAAPKHHGASFRHPPHSYTLDAPHSPHEHFRWSTPRRNTLARRCSPVATLTICPMSSSPVAVAVAASNLLDAVNGHHAVPILLGHRLAVLSTGKPAPSSEAPCQGVRRGEVSGPLLQSRRFHPEAMQPEPPTS